jgi:putative ABC transport system substrate-binding protein
MRRRTFIAGLESAAAWPVMVRAQQPAMPVIWWLGSQQTMERSLPSFAQGLTETGYVLGRNVTIEPREGDSGRAAATQRTTRRAMNRYRGPFRARAHWSRLHPLELP